jgi:predicted AlkP superfamily phosphohydrolase/phosphomutase
LRALGVAAAVAGLALLALQTGCGGGSSASAGGPKVIVLGFDGMDYSLTREYMASGVMPNFSRLAREGQFTPLGTSVPPLSPVAWSNFITGMDSGGHGIFDFIHRKPGTVIPYLSTSRTEGPAPEDMLKIGKYQIPLAGGTVELLRRGKPFWEALEENGIETTVLRMPANFPPSGTATRELSGMGTPDILGTYGTFSFYTSELFAFGGEEVSGGDVYEAWPEDGVVEATLYGPENPFLVEPEKLAVDFQVYLDPVQPVAKLVVGDEERVLQEGEWSDWVKVEFEMIPTQTLAGICRFYLRQVRPEFEMYVSPINIDPEAPAMPISTPEGYAAELAEESGMFYTQGMPEDTKAITEGVFDYDDFLAQAEIAGEELRHQYRVVLDQFERGEAGQFLFYYFGNLDQVSHIMYRATDPEHPAYDPQIDARYDGVIEGLYRDADRVVGETLEKLGDDDQLIVMSDHGFAPWRRAFNLNTWLKEEGYLVQKNPNLKKDPGLFTNVDWSQTRAYGLGFNGLYLNLEGREPKGIVDPSERQALMSEIADALLETVDPETGMPAITKVYPREEIYRDRGELELGPDLVVGYARATRVSNASTLGEITPEIFSDNTEAWSGDHGMDHESVPGILLTLRPLAKPATSLKNLAPAILGEFGIEDFPARPKGEEGGTVAAGG